MAGLLTGCAGFPAFVHKSQVPVEGGAGVDNKALAKAEARVARDMEKSGPRVDLAKAYLEDGRFQSAATTFEDALGLGDKSKETVLGLALSHIGTGQNSQALWVLIRWGDTLNQSDLGLAVALANEPEQAIHVLSHAIRHGEDTPTTRQNLAYAYALAGRWTEARMIAGRDLSGAELDNRLHEWAQATRPEQSRLRVAKMFGTSLKHDSGQPAALALNRQGQGQGQGRDQQPRMALAAAPEEKQPELPASHEGEENIASTVRVKPVTTAMRGTRSASQFEQDHAVQLGSFTSEAAAQRAWGIWLKREPALAGRTLRISQATVNGRRYYRMAAVGFDRVGAKALCQTAGTYGDSCLVIAEPCSRTANGSSSCVIQTG